MRQVGAFDQWVLGSSTKILTGVCRSRPTGADFEKSCSSFSVQVFGTSQISDAPGILLLGSGRLTRSHEFEHRGKVQDQIIYL